MVLSGALKMRHKVPKYEDDHGGNEVPIAITTWKNGSHLT